MRIDVFAIRLSLFAAAAFVFGSNSRADDAIRLREAFDVGYQYHVSCRVELSGTLPLPPDKGQPAKLLTIIGNSAIEYDERILDAGSDGEVKKTIRLYRRIDFDRKVGERQQQSTIRPAVRRLVVLRLKNAEVPFSPDGPLNWGEIDLVRTDVFTPALAGLLHDRAVKPGDRWTATRTAIQELTDMERIDEGQVECRFEGITTQLQRRHARIAFAGTVRGVNEDGPNQQQLDGYCYFDLESNHLSYLSLKGVSSLLDKEGKVLGSVEGRFVLTRQAPRKVADLSNEALRGLDVEATADNMLLLYDNPDLGIRFLHARRWRVSGVQGMQVMIDESKGSGLMLTLEPRERIPTGAQYLVESRDWLLKQKVRITRIEQPKVLRQGREGLEHFSLDVDENGQRALLDYYVTRQPVGGATIAARLLPTDLQGLQRDVERIARSVVVSKAPAGK